MSMSSPATTPGRPRRPARRSSGRQWLITALAVAVVLGGLAFVAFQGGDDTGSDPQTDLTGIEARPGGKDRVAPARPDADLVDVADPSGIAWRSPEPRQSDDQLLDAGSSPFARETYRQYAYSSDGHQLVVQIWPSTLDAAEEADAPSIAFKGYTVTSTTDGRLAGQPATRWVASYDGDDGSGTLEAVGANVDESYVLVTAYRPGDDPVATDELDRLIDSIRTR